jgi:hypothetical protein
MAPTDSDPLRQAIEHTLHKFLMSYQNASTHNDASFISSALAPDCVRCFGPSSFLKAVGAPVDFTFSNEPYQAQFAKEMTVVSIKRVEISNVCIDTASRKAAATTSYHGEFSDGEQITMEFAWFLTFSEDGNRLTKILEYVDSLDCPNYQVKINALLTELGTGGA